MKHEKDGASVAKVADLLRAGARDGRPEDRLRSAFETVDARGKKAGRSCLTWEGEMVMQQPDLAAHADRLENRAAALCPVCKKRTGRLFSVALKGSERTLTYQCVDCKRPWPVVDYSPGPNDPPVSPTQQ